MAYPENRIFCRLDDLTPAAREQKRLAAVQELGLLATETVAIFDEATQTAARFLEAPICILSTVTQEQQQIKSAFGLSSVGLMNELARLRLLPRSECFCAYVVDSHQVLAISDTITNPALASSLLVWHYGIRAYLGAPLLTANGECVGTLEVMDCVPRCFSAKDVEFVSITARWCLSEYERNHVLQQKHRTSISEPAYSLADSQENSNDLSAFLISANAVKFKLLAQLTEELRTPLTSILGMASVLNRQVYGSLTSKQKEYLEIIHQSGQQLVLLVEEIVALGLLDETSDQLDLVSIDIEMLCQQAINNLLEIARPKQQQLRLSVAPGSRIWLLNKNRVRQMLYYLLYSAIHSAEAEGEVRIHVSGEGDNLIIAVWASHLWRGDSLPQPSEQIARSPFSSSAAVASETLETPSGTDEVENSQFASNSYRLSSDRAFASTSVGDARTLARELSNGGSRESLGLLLSCHLAELQGGQIYVEGSLESGYRYIISLPKLELGEERL